MYSDHNKDIIHWVDPINSNPHFIDLICQIFVSRRIKVTVYSNLRENFGATEGVAWHYFLSKKAMSPGPRMSQLAKIKYGLAYIVGWRRTTKKLINQGARRILFSSSLRLPEIDAYYLHKLHKVGIECVFLMHRPFYDLLVPSGRKYRAIKKIMQLCPEILVMTNYAANIAINIYQQPEEKFTLFPHPHYKTFLDNYETNTTYLADLKSWCAGFPVVLYMSGLQYSHGLTDLADAIPIVHSRMPECRFLFLGNDHMDGKSSVALQIKKRFQNDNRIRCNFGFYQNSEAKACLSLSSILAVPYRDIVQSGVVPMAAGEGVPSVVTRVGGLPEMILEGISGEVAEPQNPQDFADKLCSVLMDCNKYKSDTLKVASELFSPDRCCEIIVNTLGK